MLEDRKHWKDHYEYATLGENDFSLDNDTVVLIVKEGPEVLESREGKETHLCLRLQGFDKPFKTNATICKAIEKALKTPYPSEWIGKSISIYIEKGLRAFGDVHNVPRVRTVQPRVVVDTKPAIDALKGCASMEDLGAIWSSLGVMAKQPDVLKCKNDMKESLTND